jgi:molecular chaperone HtpG
MSEKKFNAEISQVLDIVINALYTNKDVFLRELVSNASDACEKLRYQGLSNQELFENDPDLKIVVEVKKDDGIIIVTDNGIGMNEEDLVNCLGTIAKSGTKEFINQLAKSGAGHGAGDLIGQFGVGFFASFMVADKVEVVSRKAGEKEAWKWSSDGKSGYNIETINYDIPRGTSITLFLKDEYKDVYLDKFKIREIIKTYSNHINVSVFMKHENELEAAEINKRQAIWTLDKKNISDSEYSDFFKSLSGMPHDPLLIMHNKIEGNVSYSNLLFIPESKPFDLFHPDRQTRVKLYVKKVFISEDSSLDIIPKYLRFIYGIVDSSDLPLNISRQSFQDNSVLLKIRDLLTKKILSELKNLKNNDFSKYVKFWENFGSVVKEGLCEFGVDRDALMDLVLFKTTKSDSEWSSFSDYIGRMKSGQSDLYYYIAESGDYANNPQIEGFIGKNVEVILLSDHVDSFWTSVVHDYSGRALKSINRSDIDLSIFDGDNKKDDSVENCDSGEFSNIVREMEAELNGLVKKVIVSKKLTNSPASISLGDSSMDIQMEKFLIAQGQLKKASLKNLEINPHHELVKNTISLLKSENEDEKNLGKELTLAIFDIACIAQDEPLFSPNISAKRLFNVLKYIK